VLNAITVIENPRDGLCKSTIRNASVDYAIGELLWYLSGSNFLSDIKPYSKAWENLSEDGTTINSAYGHRIQARFGFDQWEYCKNLLLGDDNSRQAVIHIKEPTDVKSKDTPCTVALQYQVRQDVHSNAIDGEWKDTPKLYATTFMRSNDIWLGFPYDVFSFTAFQVKMAMELGVDVGAYTHIAGSLHLYESSLKRVK
jgi:thymidylate synthase